MDPVNLRDAHKPWIWSALVLLVTVTSLLVPAAMAQLEDTKEILAVRVREQSDQCSTPLKAERDRARSRAHESVWVLRCDNASYRLRLRMDMAAEITKLN
jgi:hypothetical protein